MLNYRQYGITDMQKYITCFLIKAPDLSAKQIYVRRMNLKTFAPQKVSMHKQKKEIKDNQTVISCLRKKIAFSKHTQEPVTDLDQFISLPRAISDASGLPVKGTKSNALKVLKSTYKDAFLTSLPVTDDAVQSTVILEGMFLINTIPLSSHRTFIDYAEFLFTRWIVKSHIQFKAQEIHVVFDHPNRNGESPKNIERSRRTHEFNQENITYNTVSSDLLLPNNWRNFLNVRDHKRKFVNYLTGGYEDLYVDKALGAGDGDISEFSDFNSNHEEEFNDGSQSGTDIVPIFELADIAKLYSKRLDRLGVVMEGMINTRRLKNWILAAIEDMQAHMKRSVVLLIFNEYIWDVLKQAIS
ncbi:unnamed protein product [Mytilus coruscus]|uniref:Uncharacterized protein n=1 Tax=Mytilus coruscus TaxID=42192 RepID=A0A6J8EL98_MYTCO|nr:unnamed protein product [Mytilus coruscus]